MKAMLIVSITYALFALFAIGINLLAQHLVLSFWSGFMVIYIALAVGTAVGLVTKFVLDKLFIFKHQVKSSSHAVLGHAFIFAKYTATGILTTAIFWGMELSCHYIFRNQYFTYLGGALGLLIGYWIKYYADKHITFVDRVRVGEL